MTQKGKPCTRCLLEQAGQTELARAIAERIAALPTELRTDEGLYKTRLEICSQCDSLQSGTCVKCGCYAELRAAKVNAACPNVPQRW